jgi:hypothetical protein
LAPPSWLPAARPGPPNGLYPIRNGPSSDAFRVFHRFPRPLILRPSAFVQPPEVCPSARASSVHLLFDREDGSQAQSMIDGPDLASRQSTTAAPIPGSQLAEPCTACTLPPWGLAHPFNLHSLPAPPPPQYQPGYLNFKHQRSPISPPSPRTALPLFESSGDQQILAASNAEFLTPIHPMLTPTSSPRTLDNNFNPSTHFLSFFSH